MKFLLEAIEWWKGKPQSPLLLALRFLRNAMNILFSFFTWDIGTSQSASVHLCPSFTPIPCSAVVTHVYVCVPVANDPLILPCWRIYFHQLRNRHKGYFPPTLPLVNTEIQPTPVRKNHLLKDISHTRDGRYLGTSLSRRKPREKQKRMWKPANTTEHGRRRQRHSQHTVGKRAMGTRTQWGNGPLRQTPARSVVSTDTQLLFPRCWLKCPPSNT